MRCKERSHRICKAHMSVIEALVSQMWGDGKFLRQQSLAALEHSHSGLTANVGIATPNDNEFSKIHWLNGRACFALSYIYVVLLKL